MDVFKPDPRYVRGQRRLLYAQFLVAAAAFTTTLVVLIFASYEKLGDNHASRAMTVLTSIAGLIFGVLALVEYYRGHRGLLRVVISRNTLAVKLPRKPIHFIKKRDMAAFGPARFIYHLRDGVEFKLSDLKLPNRELEACNTFIFEHWWPHLSIDDIKSEFESELPMPKGKIRLCFGVIFLVVSAMMILAMLMQFGIPFSIFLGAIGGLLLLLLSVLRVPGEIIRREKERDAYRFHLPASL